jgi:hypothetical protein
VQNGSASALSLCAAAQSNSNSSPLAAAATRILAPPMATPLAWQLLSSLGLLRPNGGGDISISPPRVIWPHFPNLFAKTAFFSTCARPVRTDAFSEG